MSTRSYIGRYLKPDESVVSAPYNNSLTKTINSLEGTIIASYCHFDGYPEGVGKTLIESYNTEEDAVNLVNGGSMRSLGDFYADEPRCEDYMISVFTEDEYLKNLEMIDYLYLWKDGEWYVCNDKDFVKLTTVLGVEEQNQDKSAAAVQNDKRDIYINVEISFRHDSKSYRLPNSIEFIPFEDYSEIEKAVHEWYKDYSK